MQVETEKVCLIVPQHWTSLYLETYLFVIEESMHVNEGMTKLDGKHHILVI